MAETMGVGALTGHFLVSTAASAAKAAASPVGVAQPTMPMPIGTTPRWKVSAWTR